MVPLLLDSDQVLARVVVPAPIVTCVSSLSSDQKVEIARRRATKARRRRPPPKTTSVMTCFCCGAPRAGARRAEYFSFLERERLKSTLSSVPIPRRFIRLPENALSVCGPLHCGLLPCLVASSSKKWGQQSERPPSERTIISNNGFGRTRRSRYEYV